MTPRDAALRKLAELNLSDVDRETVRALLYGYCDRWYASRWQAVAIEQEFCLPIINPNAKRTSQSRTYNYAGKIDLVVADEINQGVYYLCDHKTTSEDIEDGASPFWNRLLLATQPTHYQLALWQMGVPVAGCVWDVIRKPTIRPSKLTKADQQDIANGLYCGIPIDPGHEGDREDAYLYGIRVLSDIRENPNKYFQRRSVPRSNRELFEYARELFGTARLVRQSTADKEFFKTGAPHACTSYGRNCEYMALCSSFDHETSGQLVQIRPHSELSNGRQSDRDILTNSALSTYRQCQRKYEYRYVKGLAKPEREDSSTYFGTAMHAVLEAYWGQLLAPIERRLSFQGGKYVERDTNQTSGEATLLVGSHQ